MSDIKTKLINIEWLFVDQDHYDLIMIEVDQAVQEKCNVIIFLALMDGFVAWDPKYWIPLIDKLDNACKKLGIQEIIFISGAGKTYEYGLKHTHYFYDWNMSVVKNAYKDYDNQIKDYNNDADKFLFLTGRSARPNRIGLMSKFHDENMLKNSTWSFFPPWNEIDNKWCRNYLSKYTDKEYNEFLKNCNRSLDSDNEYNSCKSFLGVYEGDNWHDIVKEPYIHNPSFIDLHHYNDVKLTVISEGPIYWEWSNDRYYLTDKTYRELLMKKPVILSGYVEQYKELKNLGFKTFDENFLIKEYGLIEDEEQRLEAIVQNVKYFLNNSDYQKVKQDVDFNTKLLYYYFKKQDEFLKYLETKYNASKEEIEFFFNRKGLEHLIRKP